MKNKFTALAILSFALSAQAFVSQAHAACSDDDQRNSFVMANSSYEPGSLYIALSGTAPTTSASEILGYAKAAVGTGAVTVTKPNPNGLNATAYKFGHFTITVAQSGSSVCPPLSVSVNSPAGSSSKWAVTLSHSPGAAPLNFAFGGEDAVVLAGLMKTAGIVPTQDPTLEGGLSYRGKNIFCGTSQSEGGLSANCFIGVDPQN